MKISENGIEFIKNEEGLRLKAYQCSGQVWTIGYGHTKGVKENDVITEKQAEELLVNDLKFFEKEVNKLVKVYINQNMFDALVSLSFNIGTGKEGLGGSTLLKELNKNNYIETYNQFKWWRKSKGKILQGLIKRRFRERALFNSYPNYFNLPLNKDWEDEYI